MVNEVMYLVVFFLLIWTLFQCILCENCVIQNPDPKTLYVLSVQNEYYDGLMRTFLSNYEKRFNTDIDYEMDVQTDCPGQLQDALKLTKKLRYVIYYGITDFYNNNYNDVRNSDMEWYGDYGRYEEQLVCKSDKSMDISARREIRELANESCSLYRTQKRQYTMLISKHINIKESPGLYDLIHSKELSETNDERSKIKEFIIISCIFINANVIIGVNKRIIFQDTFKTIDVQYLDLHTCKYRIPNRANVIAIIAPGPEYVEKLDSYADKPIIFYDAMNNHEMVDMYKNAVLWKTELKDEVRTLWNLISQKWKRVAILSDGSAESGAYEKEIRTLFELKEVSYTVRSVEGQGKCCDFNEALSSLQTVDARIIIANVDQKYADLLVKQAQKKGMTKNHKIVWIARAWSKATCLRAAKDLQTILSVTATVDPKADDAIKVIKTLFEHDYEYSSFLNEAKFAQDIRKNYIRPSFQVVKTLSNGQQFTGYRYALRNMPNDRGECTFRSDNFDKPCDDMVVIMIPVVIVVLAATALGIMYFFDEPYTPYNRMVN